MRNKLLFVAGAFVVIGAVAAGLVYANWDEAVPIFGMAVNYVRYLSAPAGTLTTEMAAGAVGSSPVSANAVRAPAGGAEADWPSYNKTLTSDRYSELGQIDKANAGKL